MASKNLTEKSEKIKQKEENRPSSSNTKLHKNTLEEMIKKMEEMYLELNKLKSEKKSWNRSSSEGGNKSFNQYKRPVNPQILQRDKKDDSDQKVTPPFHNYVAEENEEDDNDDEDQDQDINYLHLSNNKILLNADDYKNSVKQHLSEENDCSKNLNSQILNESAQPNTQNRYNLRSKMSNSTQKNSDKSTGNSKSATPEPAVTKKKNDQYVSKSSKGQSTVEDKLSLMNVIGNEINKIKIQVPLFDFMKDKTFQHPILNLMQSTLDNILLDTVNL